MMRIKVSLIRVFIWAIQALVPSFVVSLGVPCKISFEEEGLTAIGINTEETWLCAVGELVCLQLTFKGKGADTLRALKVSVLVLVLMSI